jgi:hypothetical protein
MIFNIIHLNIAVHHNVGHSAYSISTFKISPSIISLTLLPSFYLSAYIPITSIGFYIERLFYLL